MTGTTCPDKSPRVYEYKYSLFARFSFPDTVLETFLDKMKEQGSAQLPATLFVQTANRECRNRHASFIRICDTKTGRPKEEIITATEAANITISAVGSVASITRYSEREIFPSPDGFFNVYTDVQNVTARLSTSPATLMGTAGVLKTLSSLLIAGQPSEQDAFILVKTARYGMSEQDFMNLHNVGKLLIGSAISAPTLRAVPKG